MSAAHAYRHHCPIGPLRFAGDQGGGILEGVETRGVAGTGGGQGETPSAVARRRQGFGVAAGWAAAAILFGVVAWAALQLPMDVPDTSSPVTTNHVGIVDEGGSVGQTFVPKRDNLDQIALAMSTEQRTNKAAITLRVREGGPNGPVLRTVQEMVSNLPEGDTFSFSQEHPGIMDPQWHSFRFQPIPDSAGRKLFFSVEGPYVPAQNRVRVAMKFFNGYPEGKAYVNGGEQNAHLVFRAESRAQVKDYLGIVMGNITADKQGPLANPWTYVALGTAYVVLLGGLFVVAWRTVRKGMGDRG